MSATSFTDKKGRTWEIQINLANAREVDLTDFRQHYKLEEPILLTTPPTKEVIGELFTNMILMAAVIWVLVRRQAKQDEFKTPQGTDEEKAKIEDDNQYEFISAWDGKTIDAARDAFVEAIGDFFPEAKTSLSTLNESFKELRKRATDSGLKMNPILRAKMLEFYDQKEKEIFAELEQAGVKS